MSDIPKSAFEATDKIAATLRSTNDIELTDADKTEIALIIAEPINKAMGKFDLIIRLSDCGAEYSEIKRTCGDAIVDLAGTEVRDKLEVEREES